MIETKKTPESDKVARTLFEEFCEDCEWGEEGCMQSVGVRCPVFDAVIAIVPDNPFVTHITEKFIRCSKGE